MAAKRKQPAQVETAPGIPAKQLGRPSSFTQEIADEICRRISEVQSLREICRDESMPNISTVMRWLAKHPEFREQYARAREAQADAMGEEILEISDDATNDWMERNNGPDLPTSYVPNAEHIQRSRLRVDARKWLMSKLAPKKYGDKLDVNAHITGEVIVEIGGDAT